MDFIILDLIAIQFTTSELFMPSFGVSFPPIPILMYLNFEPVKWLSNYPL